MARLRAKKDQNQNAIETAVMMWGGMCTDISSVGKGEPDLIVHAPCGNFWISIPVEIKTEDGKLTDDEYSVIMGKKRGIVFIVRQPQEAIELLIYQCLALKGVCDEIEWTPEASQFIRKAKATCPHIDFGTITSLELQALKAHCKH